MRRLYLDGVYRKFFGAAQPEILVTILVAIAVKAVDAVAALSSHAHGQAAILIAQLGTRRAHAKLGRAHDLEDTRLPYWRAADLFAQRLSAVPPLLCAHPERYEEFLARPDGAEAAKPAEPSA